MRLISLQLREHARAACPTTVNLGCKLFSKPGPIYLERHTRRASEETSLAKPHAADFGLGNHRALTALPWNMQWRVWRLRSFESSMMSSIPVVYSNAITYRAANVQLVDNTYDVPAFKLT